jgi:hypothetical protein
LGITAGLLAIATAAIIKGHHDAWAGDAFYQASFQSDLHFAICAALAYCAAWIGSYSPAYLICVDLYFGYLAVLNVKSLVEGKFIRVTHHGCVDGITGAERFVGDMPLYVGAGLVAMALARFLFDVSSPDDPPHGRYRHTGIVLATAFVLGVALIVNWR